MSGRDLVLQVGRTLTRYRRLNLAAALLFPLLLGVVIGTAFALGLLPSSFLPPSLGILAVIALYLYERGGYLLSRVTVEDAGRHLDSVTGAKERFLTLATLPEAEADPVREAIEAQVAPLAERYLTEHSERIKVEPTARLSLFLSPLAGVVLGLLLLHHEALVETPTAEANALSVARAEAVRELAERTPDLPDAMKEQLEQLATTLEERGLFSEEALKQLEQSLDGLDKLESAGENPENITLEEAQKIESKTSGEEKAQSKENAQQSLSEQKQGDERESDAAASTKQNRPEAQQDPAAQPSAQPTAVPSETPPPTSEQLHEQISNAQQQQQQQEASQQPPGGEEKQGVKSLQQKDDGDLKKGQKEQPQGESTKQGASEQKDGKKESPGEKGQQEGAGQQDDPKKGTAGVGDGKGEAKGKQSKDQIGGETDSGSDSSGAKEGSAKNDAAGGGEGDEQGAKQGDEKGKGDASGKAGEKSGEGKAQGRNDSKGEMKPGAGDSKSTQTVKEELESLKEEMTSGKPQESKRGEQGQEQKQGGDKQGGDKQGGDKQGAGEQGGEKSPKSDGAKGGKSGDKAGDKPGDGANGKQPNGGEKQGGEKGGKQPGSKGGSETAPGGEPKGEPKQPPDGEKGESQGPGNKPNTGSPDGDKQSMGEGVVPKDPNGKLRSKRPDALPAPSDTAPRFGPFDGGKDGNLKGKPEKVEEVSLLDNSEKIVVRSLGENDGKLYRNSGSAQAKTKLGEGEFAKPKSDIAESSQPIPVEYRDILR